MPQFRIEDEHRPNVQTFRLIADDTIIARDIHREYIDLFAAALTSSTNSTNSTNSTKRPAEQLSPSSPLTVADVLEIIEPVDPDSIAHAGGCEFLLNWLEGGYTDEQGVFLNRHPRITVIAGPYKPRESNRTISHQIRISVKS